MDAELTDEININDLRALMVRLDDERKATGLYIYDMETRSGVSVQSYYSWKRGARQPTTGMLVAVAETMGFEFIMRRKSQKALS